MKYVTFHSDSGERRAIGCPDEPSLQWVFVKLLSEGAKYLRVNRSGQLKPGTNVRMIEDFLKQGNPDVYGKWGGPARPPHFPYTSHKGITITSRQMGGLIPSESL